MKNIIFLSVLYLTLLTFGLNKTFAQSGWSWQNPLPQGNELRDVRVIDGNIFAVGEVGTFIKSTDDGVTWTVKHHSGGISDILYSLFYIDVNTGWAVGANGKILKTTDGGTNWFLQTSGTNNPLYSVYFTDTNNGWAVGFGGVILK